jgi:iron complex outermembrane receptor protein
MTSTSKKSGQARATLRAQAFRLSPIAAGCAALVFSSGTVYAQAAADQNLETVVVTGIRKGIEDAISVKKNADSIVESISAEDIGKLPDNSIAESIARLPGLAAQRVGGKSQTISIRGMSGDFSGTLLNGREQVSTGDNRAVEFDQYPSELLSGVTIYKTPDAGLIGQGLSGTVDMQTVRPLNFPKRVLAVNARVDHNSLGKLNAGSKSDGNRINMAYIDQFANRTFGVAIGFAHLDNPSQYQRYNSWGYPNSGAAGGALVSGGNEYKTFSGTQKRDSFMSVLEWKPSAKYTSTLDLYYSKFDESVIDRGLVVGTEWGAHSGLLNPVVQNGLLVGGTWTGVKPVIWNELQRRKDDITAVGWNNKFKFAEGWSAVADVSHSKAKRKESILEAYAGTIGTTDTFTFANNGEGRPISSMGLNYADPSITKLTDSAGWNQDGYVKYLNVTDELNAFHLAATRDMEGMFSSLEAGLHYADREKKKDVPESLLFLKSAPTDLTGSPLLLSPTSLSGNGLNGSVLAWNVAGAADTLYNFVTKNHPDIYNKNWTVNEKVATAFAKATIDTTLGMFPLRGNVGVQLVNTDQSSTAYAVDKNSGTSDANRVAYTRTDGKKYNDVLPNLNLAMVLADDQTVRLGAGKQIARARLDQLRASRNVSFDQTKQVFSGDGGNPNLDPFRAYAIDLSYEKYFGNKGYVSLATFQKNLKSYIYKQKVLADFSGLPLSASNGLTPVSNFGLFESPFNGQGGKMKGVELTASIPFSLFSSTLDGFGVIASHSLTSSSVKPNGPGDSMPLPGLSRKVDNLTTYFEKYGFSARASVRRRSAFVGEVEGFGADRELVYVAPERIVDVQLGYEIGSGAMKGLSFLIQVNNLTNAPYKEYYGTPDKLKQYSRYGSTTLLGLSYKL